MVSGFKLQTNSLFSCEYVCGSCGSGTVGDRIHWKTDMLLEEHERTCRAITQYDAENTGIKACT